MATGKRGIDSGGIALKFGQIDLDQKVALQVEDVAKFMASVRDYRVRKGRRPPCITQGIVRHRALHSGNHRGRQLVYRLGGQR